MKEFSKNARLIGVLADAHGVEHFVSYENYQKDFFPYEMRAQFNRKRHAVWFFIWLPEADLKSFESLMQKGMHVDALNHLKDVIEKLEEDYFDVVIFPDGLEDQYQESLELIPNPALDPWYVPNDGVNTK